MQSTYYKNEQQCKKIFCAYHPNQFLTNFCLKSECLMPLCPTCIHQHSQQHYQYQTKPNYINLNDALQQAKELCYQHIVQLENLQKQGSKIFIQRLRTVQDFRKQLRQYKHKVYVKIQEQFSKFQNELLQKLKSYNQENIEIQKQLQINKYNIKKTINDLYQKITFLNGQQCLSALITYHSRHQNDFQLLQKQIKISLNRFSSFSKLQAYLDTIGLNTQLNGIFNRIIQMRPASQPKINYQQIESSLKKTQSRFSNKITPRSKSKILNYQSKNKQQFDDYNNQQKRFNFFNSSYNG